MDKNILKVDFRGAKSLIIISCLSIGAYILFKLSIYSAVSKLHLEAIFILVFFGGIFFRPWQFKNDVAIRLIILGSILPLIFFIFNYWSDSSSAVKYFSFDKLVKLMGFSAIGFWLGGKLKNIYIFLTLAFLGLVVALFNVDPILAFKDIFSGKRVDFDIQNAQHTAMFFGLAIIGFISFFRELLFSTDIAKKYLKVLIISLFSAALLLSLVVFFGAQTRASLLGFDFIFVLSIIHFTIIYIKHRTSKKVLYLFCIYVVLCSILLSVFTIHTLDKRGSEDKVTEILSNGEIENIPMSSLGVRINSWIEASKWIKQKPLHGWGGGVRTDVFQKSNFSDAIKKHYGHFHNTYIEFTLAYGLIGLSFILYIYWWVNRRIYSLAKNNRRYQGVCFFTLYGSLFLMVINIFESYLFFRTGVYATAILLAPAYSLYLSNLYHQIHRKGLEHNEA